MPQPEQKPPDQSLPSDGTEKGVRRTDKNRRKIEYAIIALLHALEGNKAKEPPKDNPQNG